MRNDDQTTQPEGTQIPAGRRRAAGAAPPLTLTVPAGMEAFARALLAALGPPDYRPRRSAAD